MRLLHCVERSLSWNINGNLCVSCRPWISTLYSDSMNALIWRRGLIADVRQQCSEKESLFASICRYFKEMIREVIDCYGSLRVTTNKHGHLEFHAEITDAAGKTDQCGSLEILTVG